MIHGEWNLVNAKGEYGTILCNLSIATPLLNGSLDKREHE